MNIKYVVGDATSPRDEGPCILVHICNDIRAWGRGFVLALSRKWPQPEIKYRAWVGGELEIPFELGQVQFVEVEPQLWVANLIGQHDIRRRGGKPPVRYDAIRHGLQRVAQHARTTNATVHMPRIGAGLAGGDWAIISKIIHDELTSNDIPVTVYDLTS